MANDRSDPWPTLVLIGVICGIAIGTLIVLLRRRDSELDRLLLSSGSDSLGLSLNELSDARIDPLIPVSPPMGAISPLARTQTISTTNPTFLLKATGSQDWTVHVRVIGPPGALATFIYSNSSSDRFVVPAGAHDTLRLPGYQSLYAVGSTTGVSVSVSGGA